MKSACFGWWVGGLVAVMGLVVFATPAPATILTFDITDPGVYPVSEDFPEGFRISEKAPGYGDNVSGSPVVVGTATYAYGDGGEGFTPDVTADYGPFSIFTGGPE